MRSNKTRKAGISILEVTLACVIMALAILPIYRALSSSAEAEIETTKIAMAKEILESMRQEILSHPFDDISAQVSTVKTYSPLAGQPYTRTLGKILEAQKKYKLFDLTVLAQFNNTTKTIIQIEGKVTFTSKGGHPKSETLTFIQVSDK